MEAGKYIIGQSEDGEQDERLRLLAEVADPDTFGFLSDVGIAAAWSCLEVGAGSGTVAAWMAQQVGQSGRVVATDIDVSKLQHLSAQSVEVREHNVLDGPVELEAFDLVHCRALLLHLTDPAQAVANMWAATRPGGWLVLEDADFGSMRSATIAHPATGQFDEAWAALSAGLNEAGVMRSYLGAEVIGLLDGLDVDQLESFGRFDVVRGGSNHARFWQLSWETVTPTIIGAGFVTDTTAEVVRQVFSDPTFAFVPPTSVMTRARRSEYAER